MLFSIDEIKRYLESHNDLTTAVERLNEQAVVDCIPVGSFDSSTSIENEKSIWNYEDHIGMAKAIEHQKSLYKSTNGEQGRYWKALFPEWNKGQNELTEFRIIYWVDRGDNQTYGFFSVEEIKRWFNNPKLKLHEIGGIKQLL